MTRSNGSPEKPPEEANTVKSLSVSGFKSIVEEQTIEVRPLTLLAGANSSGKTSMMQPLLLLKQTLEAQYDPGPLLLNGPNVNFTSVSQFRPSPFSQPQPKNFTVTVGAANRAKYSVAFRNEKKLQVDYNIYSLAHHSFKLKHDSYVKDVLDHYLKVVSKELSQEHLSLVLQQLESSRAQILKSGFTVEVVLFFKESVPGNESFHVPFILSPRSNAFEGITQRIMGVIHLPGLRGNPERTYPVAAIGPHFPGTFEKYVASLISHWSAEASPANKEVGDDLKALGLTWKVEAKRLEDTQVELQVGRLTRSRKGGAQDLVSIADVGFGVSQTLPVVVALRAARPGQLVYIEQPEIHLHPRAQAAMARLLVNAAKRGVRVVAETHSSLLLLAVQTLVAEGVIEPNLIKLNWFLRSGKDGTTRIQIADLDEAGRFGNWPEDFDEVALTSENRYLSAAEARLARK